MWSNPYWSNQCTGRISQRVVIGRSERQLRRQCSPSHAHARACTHIQTHTHTHTYLHTHTRTNARARYHTHVQTKQTRVHTLALAGARAHTLFGWAELRAYLPTRDHCHAGGQSKPAHSGPAVRACRTRPSLSRPGKVGPPANRAGLVCAQATASGSDAAPLRLLRLLPMRNPGIDPVAAAAEVGRCCCVFGIATAAAAAAAFPASVAPAPLRMLSQAWIAAGGSDMQVESLRVSLTAGWTERRGHSPPL